MIYYERGVFHVHHIPFSACQGFLRADFLCIKFYTNLS
nr:MAG TPA: hypothetical protein [Caudoviricetes sp.]